LQNRLKQNERKKRILRGGVPDSAVKDENIDPGPDGRLNIISIFPRASIGRGIAVNIATTAFQALASRSSPTLLEATETMLSLDPIHTNETNSQV
jgi:hypothetical protein